MDDMEFMEEILEKRMVIEESDDASEISKIKVENDAVVKKMLENISQLFDKNEYAEALALIEKLKYFDRISQAL